MFIICQVHVFSRKFPIFRLIYFCTLASITFFYARRRYALVNHSYSKISGNDRPRVILIVKNSNKIFTSEFCGFSAKHGFQMPENDLTRTKAFENYRISAINKPRQTTSDKMLYENNVHNKNCGQHLIN